MRKVNAFFHKESMLPLYHYTGVSSLIGMSKTNALWASHAYYLNDSMEIIEACEKLKKIILTRLENKNINETEASFLSQVKNWISELEKTPYCIFIFSLSEDPNLLSQWRSYTPHGKGISICFPQNVVNSIAKKSNLKIAKCLYSLEEHMFALSDLIDKLLTSFNREKATIDTSKSHPTQSYY